MPLDTYVSALALPANTYCLQSRGAGNSKEYQLPSFSNIITLLSCLNRGVVVAALMLKKNKNVSSSP
jgi:hypothetical protein